MQLKKLRYLVAKAIKDVSSPLIYKVDEDEKKLSSKNELGNYYYLFDRIELLQGGSYYFNFDQAGIPMVRGNLADDDDSYYYNPQAICQYALSLYNDHVADKNPELLEEFLKICNFCPWVLRQILKICRSILGPFCPLWAPACSDKNSNFAINLRKDQTVTN